MLVYVDKTLFAKLVMMRSIAACMIGFFVAAPFALSMDGDEEGPLKKTASEYKRDLFSYLGAQDQHALKTTCRNFNNVFYCHFVVGMPSSKVLFCSNDVTFALATARDFTRVGQWRSLVIDWGISLASTSKIFSELKSFAYMIDDASVQLQYLTDDQIDTINNLPMLTSVRLSFGDGVIDSRATKLVTNTKFRRVALFHCFDIPQDLVQELLRNPNLESLIIYVKNKRIVSLPHERDVILPNLQTLELTGFCLPAKIFKNLRTMAPNIKSLQLSHLQECSNDTANDLLSLNLDNFSIRGDDLQLESDNLSSILRRLGGDFVLILYDIVGGSGPDEILSKKSPHDRIEYVKFCDKNPLSFVSTLLAAPNEKVQFVICELKSEAILETIKALAKNSDRGDTFEIDMQILKTIFTKRKDNFRDDASPKIHITNDTNNFDAIMMIQAGIDEWLSLHLDDVNAFSTLEDIIAYEKLHTLSLVSRREQDIDLETLKLLTKNGRLHELRLKAPSIKFAQGVLTHAQNMYQTTFKIENDSSDAIFIKKSFVDDDKAQ